MATRRKHENKPQRLAKNLSADQTRSRSRRARKNSLRTKSGRNAGGAVADERSLSPLIRLVGAFRTEKIGFQLIGMSAAVLQIDPLHRPDASPTACQEAGKTAQGTEG